MCMGFQLICDGREGARAEEVPSAGGETRRCCTRSKKRAKNLPDSGCGSFWMQFSLGGPSYGAMIQEFRSTSFVNGSDAKQ